MNFAPSRPRTPQTAPPAHSEAPRPAGLESLEARELLSGSPQILAAGDSITFGTPNPDQSYRRELDRAISAVGANAEFVGSRSDGRGFDGNHYSQPGIRAEVSYRGSRGDWRTSLNDGFSRGEVLNRNERPDLILLHIGTNSINGNRGSVDTAVRELATLLDTLADRWRRGEFASEVTILLADIIPGGRREGGGGGFVLDTNRLENTRSYNARIGSVINGIGDRGFANRIQRVDLARIDASTLDPSAFTAAERRALDNDGDRWVDWFNGVDENGSQRGATGNNSALTSNDLLHPTALGYRVLGQAWFNAIEATGKLRTEAPRTNTPAPRPTPTPTPTVAGQPSIQGAATATVGTTYQLRLNAAGANVDRWYIGWDDGSRGQYVQNVSTVNHTFTSPGNRTIRVFAEINGRRVGVDPVRLTVSNQATPPSRTPAPSPAAGQVAISGSNAATVGRPYEVRFNTGGIRGANWYISFGDSTRGRFVGDVDRITHTFTSTAGERVIRAFAEIDGRRIGADPIRLGVRSA